MAGKAARTVLLSDPNTRSVRSSERLPGSPRWAGHGRKARAAGWGRDSGGEDVRKCQAGWGDPERPAGTLVRAPPALRSLRRHLGREGAQSCCAGKNDLPDVVGVSAGGGVREVAVLDLLAGLAQGAGAHLGAHRSTWNGTDEAPPPEPAPQGVSCTPILESPALPWSAAAPPHPHPRRAGEALAGGRGCWGQQVQ